MLQFNGSKLKRFSLYVIASTCMTCVSHAQELCARALNVLPPFSFTAPIDSLSKLNDKGYFFPSETVETTTSANKTVQKIRRVRKFPFLFGDFIHSGSHSLFRKEIDVKLQTGIDIFNCLELPNSPICQGKIPTKVKRHLTEVITSSKMQFSPERNEMVQRYYSTIVPGEMLFARIEINSLSQLYKQIGYNFDGATLERISSPQSKASASDKEMASLALQGERKFVETYTLRSMQSIGYHFAATEGLDGISHFIGAFFAPVKRF